MCFKVRKWARQRSLGQEQGVEQLLLRVQLSATLLVLPFPGPRAALRAEGEQAFALFYRAALQVPDESALYPAPLPTFSPPGKTCPSSFQPSLQGWFSCTLPSFELTPNCLHPSESAVFTSTQMRMEWGKIKQEPGLGGRELYPCSLASHLPFGMQHHTAGGHSVPFPHSTTRPATSYMSQTVEICTCLCATALDIQSCLLKGSPLISSP